MEGELVEVGEYPHINCCGNADVQVLPDGRVRYILWDWHALDGIWRRIVVGIVTRQATGLAEDYRRAWEIIHSKAPNLPEPLLRN